MNRSEPDDARTAAPDALDRNRDLSEAGDSLWTVTWAPTLWALHFLGCYIPSAIVCAHFSRIDGIVEDLRAGIAILTGIALIGIALVGWRGWRRWDYLHDKDYEHGGAADEDRHEFLGHATVLLAVISFVGVIYTSLPALILHTCQ